jgi:hypothetical protein
MIMTSNAAKIRSVMADTCKRQGLAVDTTKAGMLGVSMGEDSAIISQNGGIEIEGMATYASVDCDDEVVLADGLSFKTFETYRAIFADHFYGTRNVVATLRWIRPVKGIDGTTRGWRMRARLMDVNKFEDAARVLELAKAGALGFSIGFAPTDRGALTPAEQKMYPAARTITRKADVFEVSATPMPCNMSCAGVSVVADEGKAARLQSLVTKGMAWAKPALDYYRPEKRTIYIVD